jgi:hypothetical protein
MIARLTMTSEDLTALRRAIRSLEHPGLAARLTNIVGKPISNLPILMDPRARETAPPEPHRGWRGGVE